MPTKTLDDSTQASHPGHFRLSHTKLKRLQPELYSLTKWLGFLARNPLAMLGVIDRGFWKTHIEEHLMYGDSRAALVISVSPLLISAYSDEIDCIALLRFDDSFAEDYDLKIGSRLITVNTYSDLQDTYEEDLFAGSKAYGRYGNFSPFIAKFLTDDNIEIENRKTQIKEDEWLRVKVFSDEYLSKPNAKARDGRPLFCALPANLPIKR